MSVDKRARLKQWLESGEAKLHPLTFPQRELWEASAITVANPANHICCLIYIRGLLAQKNCEAAFQRVVERQEVLRLSFLPGKERPLQMVRATGESRLEFRDLTPVQAETDALEALAQEIFRESFDLVQGPLYRAVMLRRAADDHVVVFVIHHAIADGWTLGVFVQDLFGAYLQEMMGAPEPLPPVPLSYTAWGAAERALWQPAELAARAAFWKKELADAPRLWAPASAPAPLRRWFAQLPAELGASARAVAKLHGATLFSTLLAGFQAALAQRTGADDFVLLVPTAERAKPAVRETMGYTSGNVPVRCRLARDRPFAENLRATHEATVAAFANAMPFAELAAALGEKPAPGRHPIADVRFALQNHPVPDIALPTLSAKLRMRSAGTARFDLACEITETPEALQIIWLARPDLFSQAEIEDLHRLLQALLTAACRSPESPLAALAPSLK